MGTKVMRGLCALVLAAILSGTALLGVFAVVPSAIPVGYASAAADYGPHLMRPKPGQSSFLPPEPFGWTGAPSGTRSSEGTRALGQQSVVVILVDFPSPDQASVSSGSINTLINSATPGQSSVRNYYQEASYSLFGITGTVSTWYRSSSPMSEYGGDSGASSFDDANGPIYRLVIDAVRLAEADGSRPWRFSDFDSDPVDGVVDHLIVVHAGDAQEEHPTRRDLIWSHRWSVADADPSAPGTQRLVADGVQIYGYIMAAETSPVGVFVHELGHDLGLPDLYDTDGSSLGVGEWDVMGSGSWNGAPSGSKPSHFSAPSKIELGWIVPTEVDRPLPSQPILQAMDHAQAFKMVVRAGADEESFIVENRQRAGFDTGLPGDGLLIWHVDLSIPGNADETHRRVDLEEADGDDQPTEATDAWADSIEGFGPDTDPSSRSYQNQRTDWKVRRIGPSGPTMVADLSREIVDDLVVLAIQRDCCVPIGGTVPVSASVGNRGARTQTDISVTLNAYHGSPAPSAIICCGAQSVPILAQGETVNLTWSVPVAAAGKYVLEVVIPFAADQIPENNLLFAHFVAATFRFYDSVESGDVGWTRNGDPGDPAIWEIVQDNANETHSHSATHAWRFHTTPALPPLCPPFCPPVFHTLTSPPISAPLGPTYFFFWHKYDLRGRGIDNLTGTQESDQAWVNVSVNGVWHSPPPSVVPFVDDLSDWRAFQWDLTQYLSGSSSTIVIEFSVSDVVLQDAGGWWIDDISIADTPLLGGVVARAVTPEATAEPGGVAMFRIKVANVGDFEENVGFDLSLPQGWSAGVGPNATTLQDYRSAQLLLRPDGEANLLLVFQVSLNATRGSRFPISVTVVSTTDASLASTFDTLTIINDPFGLAGLMRYLFLFIIVFAVIVVIAVVVDAVKKQRGISRRW